MCLLITLLRVFIGLILFLSGTAKVTSFKAFVGHVALYGILPMSLVTPASYFLASAEVILGSALILGYFSRGAGLLAALFFLIFAGALAFGLWRKLPLEECGCANILFDWLGLSKQPNWKAVFLDLTLWMGSFLVARSPQQSYGVEFLFRAFSQRHDGVRG